MKTKRKSGWTKEQRASYEKTMAARRKTPTPQVRSVEFPLDAIPDKTVTRSTSKKPDATTTTETKLLRQLVVHYLTTGRSAR